MDESTGFLDRFDGGGGSSKKLALDSFDGDSAVVDSGTTASADAGKGTTAPTDTVTSGASITIVGGAMGVVVCPDGGGSTLQVQHS